MLVCGNYSHHIYYICFVYLLYVFVMIVDQSFSRKSCFSINKKFRYIFNGHLLPEPEVSIVYNGRYGWRGETCY